ncbi:PCYCGC motif-containing (lipo)protein [Virgibacillus kekensis]|uniref:PCYCGC motif-containing (Lipo)protein n=1 Tax=Virgibacillus kekensis TaxID=202261 RepID=A0ABV9DLK7_9BACI
MKKYIWILAVLILALVACSNAGEKSEEQEEHASGLPVDDSLEGLSYNMKTNEWSPMMVKFLAEVNDPRVKDAYETAIHNADVLDYMPCYCGCYDSNGHESNTHCFVDEFNGDVVALDSMGFSCGICIDIAKTSVAKYKAGESLVEIRNYIDDNFGGNGIGPTPTPMPQG